MAGTGTAARSAGGTATALEDAARRLVSGGAGTALGRVAARSIAVASGKGGVGKTITSCNLALHYARRGMRVGLVDLDPLSDVAALLDMQDAEAAVVPAGKGAAAGGAPGGGDVVPFCRGLDVLFPAQKLSAARRAEVASLVYGARLDELDARYDLLLFDLPAGLGYEDNLAWLPLMGTLVLVTNPEPTAHASAGAWMKEVQARWPGRVVLVWHNRFTRRARDGFRPRDVAGNYNALVPPEERLTPRECSLLREVAFVPEDPSLDLLRGEPAPGLLVLRGMRDALAYADERLVTRALRPLDMPPRLHAEVAGWIARAADRPRGPAESVAALEAHLHSADGAGPGAPDLPAALRDALAAAFERLARSRLRREILRAARLVSDEVRQVEESRAPFAAASRPRDDAPLDREIGRFLVILGRAARASEFMRGQGVLLLYHFALHKLLQSRTLARLVRGLVPRRMDGRGRRVRDRGAQVRMLVEGDAGFRARYLAVLKALHGLVLRQLAAIARALDVQPLLLSDAEGRLDGRPYLRLLSSFLHEALYSGLSVIVGFEYRTAAAAFQEGAEKVLAGTPGRR